MMAEKNGSSENCDFTNWISYTDRDVDEILKILKTNDGLKFFSPCIAPKLTQVDAQKKAILLALASHWDEWGDRWRIHVLMYGKDSSGTAKTPMLKFVESIGGGFTGIRSTEAGLTVNLKDGSEGFLPIHHRNVVGLDEIDKWSKKDRDGCLEAMESGEIAFISAGHKGVFPAEVIVLAGANDPSVFTPEQFGRFDFKFEMTKYDVNRAKTISRQISRFMGRPKPEDHNLFLEYLAWIRRYNVEIPDNVREKGSDIIEGYIESSGNVDIRQVEAIWRVSRSLARLNHRECLVEDVERSIKILDETNKDGR